MSQGNSAAIYIHFFPIPTLWRKRITVCQDLRRKLTGQRPSSSYFKTVTKLGEAIAAGGFQAIAGIGENEILMPY